MRHGSLFSGIGGFDLAAEWMGWENVFQVERDEWCQKVLTKNFPNVAKFKDVKEFNGNRFKGKVDVVSGGFPCQPFSSAGKRAGSEDERYLWPEMLRIINEIQPTFICGENVAGIISMGNGRTLERICIDLEDSGYKVEIFLIPACAVGAWHRRDRVWIFAHSKSFRWELQGKDQIRNTQKTFTNRRHQFESLDGNYVGQLATCGTLRVDNGLSDWVDRIKGLGNAIVPQVAYEIFKAIEQN